MNNELWSKMKLEYFTNFKDFSKYEETEFLESFFLENYNRFTYNFYNLMNWDKELSHYLYGEENYILSVLWLSYTNWMYKRYNEIKSNWQLFENTKEFYDFFRYSCFSNWIRSFSNTIHRYLYYQLLNSKRKNYISNEIYNTKFSELENQEVNILELYNNWIDEKKSINDKIDFEIMINKVMCNFKKWKKRDNVNTIIKWLYYWYSISEMSKKIWCSRQNVDHYINSLKYEIENYMEKIIT